LGGIAEAANATGHVLSCWQPLYVFQQDRTAQPLIELVMPLQLLQEDTEQFNTPDLGPPNSPDLNLVDYCIWDVMQE